MSTSISLGEQDAQILTHLQTLAEPVYIGDFTPLESDFDDLGSLIDNTFDELDDDTTLAFALFEESITALYFDMREFSPDDNKKILSQIVQLINLRHLILYLTDDIQLELSTLEQLQHLELRASSDVTIVVPELDALKKLRVLVVGGQVDTEFTSIKACTSLLRVVMKATTLKEFPVYVCELSELLWLEFGGSFSSIPSGIGNLQNLRILEVISDELEILPLEMGELSKLGNLSIESSKLTEFPTSFDDLQTLTDLYLWNLPIRTIPKEIFHLTGLRYFWIKDNARLRGTLQVVPDEIGNLDNLINLELNGHEIAEIPPSIGKLTKLQTLNLGINSIRELPNEISKLKSLTKLELYTNEFTKFPPQIIELSSLEYLDIGDNLIETLHPDFGNLTELSSFDAMGCPLVKLPESLTNIPYENLDYFVISMVDTDVIPLEVKTWLEQLLTHANENIEKGIQVEVSRYEKD